MQRRSTVDVGLMRDQFGINSFVSFCCCHDSFLVAIISETALVPGFRQPKKVESDMFRRLRRVASSKAAKQKVQQSSKPNKKEPDVPELVQNIVRAAFERVRTRSKRVRTRSQRVRERSNAFAFERVRMRSNGFERV